MGFVAFKKSTRMMIPIPTPPACRAPVKKIARRYAEMCEKVQESLLSWLCAQDDTETSCTRSLFSFLGLRAWVYTYVRNKTDADGTGNHVFICMALLHGHLALHGGLDAWCRTLLLAAVLLVVLRFSVARSTAYLPAELPLVLIFALISPGIGVGIN